MVIVKNRFIIWVTCEPFDCINKACVVCLYDFYSREDRDRSYGVVRVIMLMKDHGNILSDMTTPVHFLYKLQVP